MKRIGLYVASSLFTFSVGFCLYALLGPLMRSDEIQEPSALYVTRAASEAPARARIETEDGARTPDDFREFWSEFKAAVAREDIDATYGLTTQQAFNWPANGKRNGRERCTQPSVSFEPPGLLIGPECYYLIGDREEFALEYHSIFTRAIRRMILKREPMQNWPDSYILNVPGPTLMFVNDGRGFKFAGAWKAFRGTTVYD